MLKTKPLYLILVCSLVLSACAKNRITEFRTIDIYPVQLTNDYGMNTEGDRAPLCPMGTCTCFADKIAQTGYKRKYDPGTGPFNCSDNCICVWRARVEFDIPDQLNLGVGDSIFSAVLHWQGEDTRSVPGTTYPAGKSCTKDLYIVNSLISDFTNRGDEKRLRPLYPISKFGYLFDEVSEQSFADVTEFVKGESPESGLPPVEFAFVGPNESLRTLKENHCYTRFAAQDIFLRVQLVNVTNKWPG